MKRSVKAWVEMIGTKLSGIELTRPKYLKYESEDGWRCIRCTVTYDDGGGLSTREAVEDAIDRSKRPGKWDNGRKPAKRKARKK